MRRDLQSKNEEEIQAIYEEINYGEFDEYTKKTKIKLIKEVLNKTEPYVLI